MPGEAWSWPVIVLPDGQLSWRCDLSASARAQRAREAATRAVLVANAAGSSLSDSARWLGPSYTQLVSEYAFASEPAQQAQFLASLTRTAATLVGVDAQVVDAGFTLEQQIRRIHGWGEWRGVRGNVYTPLREPRSNDSVVVTFQIERQPYFSHWLSEPVPTDAGWEPGPQLLPQGHILDWAQAMAVPISLFGHVEDAGGDVAELWQAGHAQWRTLEQWQTLARVLDSEPTITRVRVHDQLCSAREPVCTSQYGAIAPGWGLACEALWCARACENEATAHWWRRQRHDQLMMTLVGQISDQPGMRVLGIAPGRVYLEWAPARANLPAIQGVTGYFVTPEGVSEVVGDDNRSVAAREALLRKGDAATWGQIDAMISESHTRY